MRFSRCKFCLDGTHLLSPLFNGLHYGGAQLEFYQLVSHSLPETVNDKKLLMNSSNENETRPKMPLV